MSPGIQALLEAGREKCFLGPQKECSPVSDALISA